MNVVDIIKDIKRGELPGVAYMLNRIWEYAGQYSKEYSIPRVYLFVDYFLCAFIYGCSGINYFLYRFFLLKRKGKLSFVTEDNQDDFEKAHTDPKMEAITEDKEETLVHFADYMKRDWCGTKYNNSEESFDSFYNKHGKGIIKPLNGLGGRGVEVVTLRERFQSGAELRSYCMENKLLIEELIPQHDEMSLMYPNAINTIRVVTLKGKLIGASLRMGVGEANVDNAHSGGIFAEVDVNEGIVIGGAIRYTNERFLRHPSTGTAIPGFKIPFWQECVSMVEQASKIIEEVYLIGWDVAITPNGPTLVEVNTQPGLELVQAPNGHGLKSEFDKIK